MTDKILILKKAGSLRSGYEGDKGVVYHAVEAREAAGGGRALCGTQPGMAWGTHEGDRVTCDKCRERLEQLTELS